MTGRVLFRLQLNSGPPPLPLVFSKSLSPGFRSALRICRATCLGPRRHHHRAESRRDTAGKDKPPNAGSRHRRVSLFHCNILSFRFVYGRCLSVQEALRSTQAITIPRSPGVKKSSTLHCRCGSPGLGKRPDVRFAISRLTAVYFIFSALVSVCQQHFHPCGLLQAALAAFRFIGYRYFILSPASAAEAVSSLCC